MLVDRLGKQLEAGQWVDIHINGRFQALVTEVNDGAVQIPGQAPVRPSITINIPSPVYSKDGHSIDNVYIVADARTDSKVSLADASSELKQ